MKTWPSAYGSSILVQEYKQAGGRYRDSSRSRSRSPLRRWHREKWVDLSRPKRGGGYEPCGRQTKGMTMVEYKKKYPYCRPSKKVSSKTPITAGELSKREIKSAIRTKRKTALPEKGRSRRSRRVSSSRRYKK